MTERPTIDAWVMVTSKDAQAACEPLGLRRLGVLQRSIEQLLRLDGDRIGAEQGHDPISRDLPVCQQHSLLYRRRRIRLCEMGRYDAYASSGVGHQWSGQNRLKAGTIREIEVGRKSCIAVHIGNDDTRLAGGCAGACGTR